jgi:hypothetical protein
VRIMHIVIVIIAWVFFKKKVTDPINLAKFWEPANDIEVVIYMVV